MADRWGLAFVAGEFQRHQIELEYKTRAGPVGTRRIGDQVIAEVSRADAIDLLKGNRIWRDTNADLARELLGGAS
jgi:hypothetical protein